MKRLRVGSSVAIENVDPHTGSYVDMGIVVGWGDINGNPCQRKNSVCMLVECFNRKIAAWDDWHEQHTPKIMTLDDFESLKEE